MNNDDVMRVHKARTALLLMSSQMHAIRLQFRRIAEDQTNERRALEAWKQAMWDGVRTRIKGDKDWSHHQRTLFADTHFLLVSLAMVDKLLRMFEITLPDEPEFKRIRAKYQPSLKIYSSCRNALEHVYDQVKIGVQILGNLKGDAFIFDKTELDIPTAKREVEMMYKEISAAVEAIEKKHLPTE